MKCLGFDRGGEFTSNELKKFYNDKGIKRQISTPRSPLQNGIAKRRNRSIIYCTRTLMMEMNVALKCQREVVSTTIYTLNCVQVKKGTHSTPFELWYRYSRNVNYFKVFGSKCYILKDFRNGKLDAKSEEGIFLGYSTRRKAYKCLNTNTNKVVESANVRFDEYTEVYEAEPMKKSKEYKSFAYFYEGIPTDEDVANQVKNQQQVLVTIESHPMSVKMHSGTELHSDAKLQNEGGAHNNFEVSIHERDVEIPNRNIIVTLKLKDKMKKQGLSQDCPCQKTSSC